jgi:hypothetical protein
VVDEHEFLLEVHEMVVGSVISPKVGSESFCGLGARLGQVLGQNDELRKSDEFTLINSWLL